MTQSFFSLIFALILSPASAEPVTLSHINELPTAEQSAWKTYVVRSQTNALVDAAVVQAPTK